MLFHRLATAKGAASLYKKTDGDVLRISKACVLRGPMYASEKLEAEKLLPYGNLPEFVLSDPMAAEPSRMIDPIVVWLEGEQLPMYVYLPLAHPPVGGPAIWVLVPGADAFKVVRTYPMDATSLMATLLIRLYTMPLEVFQEAGKSLEAMKPSLCRPRMQDVQGLRLFGETSVLFTSMSLAATSDKRPRIVYTDGTACVLDGYDDEKHAWKQAVKEKKVKQMKGDLPRPSQVKAKPAEVTEVNKDTATPEEKAAVNTQIHPASVPLGTIAVPNFPAPAPVEAAPVIETVPAAEVVQEQPAPAPEPDFIAEEEAAAKPVEQVPEVKVVPESKPKRPTKPVSKPVNNTDAIAKVTELLGADVQDMTAEKFDDALNEIRAIRDLQIASARRMTNLCAALCKSSQTVMKKYSDIMAVINAVK